MRCSGFGVILFGWIVLALADLPSAAEAKSRSDNATQSVAGHAKRLVMPFACSVKGRRVRVEPSPPRYFDIAGNPALQTVELCSPDQGARRIKGARQSLTCFKTEVARFDLSCDGGRARWVDVAARAAPAFGGGAKLRRGTLRLQFRGRLTPGHTRL
ncbi:MAG: hypothetical protein AAFY64_09825, partial [Pseudomonadota bacterium]